MPEHTVLLSQLRQALAHLDDPLYLESLDLARQVSLVARTSNLPRGQNLRRALQLAIAALDPGQNPGPQGVEPRSYQVLCRYAIAKESMLAIARQLDISQRQAYRELYRAIEALALILSDLAPSSELAESAAPRPAGSPAAKVRAELERLASAEAQEIDLGALLAGVVESVRALAQGRQVAVQLVDDTIGLHVATNRVMLRQALINLLSHMVSTHQGETIRVELHGGGPGAPRSESSAPLHEAAPGRPTDRGVPRSPQALDRDIPEPPHEPDRGTAEPPPAHEARIRMRYRPATAPDPVQSESPYAMAVQLINTLGLGWTESEEPQGEREVAIDVPLARRHAVLVVDDNEGVIALFTRYLRHRPFSLVGARDYHEALAKLAEVQPEVIILDVMLPNQDGWEVLQALRAHPLGRRARIIICSIINDPELARALGADGFLHKPVDRLALLQALDGVLAAGR